MSRLPCTVLAHKLGPSRLIILLVYKVCALLLYFASGMYHSATMVDLSMPLLHGTAAPAVTVAREASNFLIVLEKILLP